jgi:putative ABC transport system substrate-binding protein
MIGRRELLALFGGAVAVWPHTSRAASGRPRIAVLALGSKEVDAGDLAAFRNGLRPLGYIEGETVDIDYRYADGAVNRLPVLALELLQSNPDIIFTDTPSAAVAAQAATSSLPIVCPSLTDAVLPSLATGYAHPSGNVTGLSNIVEEITGKLVDLALDTVPAAKRIGLLVNPAGASTAINRRQVMSAAQGRKIVVVTAEAGSPDGLRLAFQQFAAKQVQAVIVPRNAYLISLEPLLLQLALAQHLPTFFAFRAAVDAGGLASYGIKIPENFQRAAVYVDKILKGAKPGDLPIEFPTTLELVVNLKTAKALGLTIPPTLLARADEVIE